MSMSQKSKTALPLTVEGLTAKNRSSETNLSTGSANLLEKHKDLLTTIWQWGVLIISLIGGASVGLFYFYVQIECQLLKSAWRLLALVFAMIPLVYFEYKREKESFLYSKENLLNIKSWIKMFWASAGHSIWTVATLISVNYTSVAQSFVFLNLHSIIIVGYNYLKGNAVSRFEVVGSLLATKGTIFLAFDDEIESKEGMVDLSLVSFWDRIIYGDIVGILGSVGACLYFVKNHELKNDFPLYLGIMIMTVMGFLQISVASFIMEDPTFSFDPMNGLFGLFTQEWFVTYIYIIIVTGYGAYVAYVLALKYFDALLVSIVLTLEPVAGALMVFLLGWQSFPGPLTILGFLFILPGIIVVTVGKSKRKEQENQENVVKQSENKMQVPLLNVSQ